jgi:hypothetical protein
MAPFSQLTAYGREPMVLPSELGAEESKDITQSLERKHMLEHKFGEYCCGYSMDSKLLGYGMESYEIYGVKYQTTKKDGKIFSAVRGTVVATAKGKCYTSIKVCAEMNSKKEGKIKRFAELSIFGSTSLPKDRLLPHGAAYTNFEWAVPKDIDLDSLNIVEVTGQTF